MFSLPPLFPGSKNKLFLRFLPADRVFLQRLRLLALESETLR